ncbi:MAG TPA: hypothetical protein VFE15_14425 [Marmoricola sp.]|nr:hypothetical protein [Marmoricola sp.]
MIVPRNRSGLPPAFVSGLLAVVVMGSLTACGSGDAVSAYCSRLKTDQSIFADDGTGLELVTNLAKLTSLGDAAPSDIGADWQTFLNGIEVLDDAVRKAGVAPKDFVDGKPPTGLAADKRAAIAAAADQLSSDNVVSAASDIEQEAKDVCQLDLGL